MKKRMVLSTMLAIFLFTGIFSGLAMADQFQFTSITGSSSNIGQVNFLTNPAGVFQWGYCTEPHTYSNYNTWYDYNLIGVTGYYAGINKDNLGLIAADLIWKQYNDGNVSATEMTALQTSIWHVYDNYSQYNSYLFVYDKALLESLFDIAFVANILGANGVSWNQDFIVFKPVPEPVSMLLFGTGLIGVGEYIRRKFKK